MTKLYGFTPEPGTSATRVVNQEILKASVVVHQFPRAVQDKVNDPFLMVLSSRVKCWRRPLFPRSVARGERAAGTCRCALHPPPMAQDQRRLLEEHAYLHPFSRRKC